MINFLELDEWLINKPLDSVIHGDCIKGMSYIPNEYVDEVVTDPPYLMKYKTNHRKDKSHEFCNEIENDDNPDLISDYIKECYRIMKNNTAMYMFCNQNKEEFFKQELEKYFTIRNKIIWVKNNWTAGDLKCSFGKQYEILFLVNKGKREINGKRLTDVWNFNRVAGKKQIHQNEKPLDLIEQCIVKHSNPGDIIFDGFSGSSVTALASLNLRRRFLAFELKDKYINRSKQKFGLNNFI